MSHNPRTKRQGKNPETLDINRIYADIRMLLDQARQQAWLSVNTVMVQAYWNVGRIIVEEEQRGAARADYGKRLVEALSVRLRQDYGQGFDPSNLWNMKAFYLAYPILDAVRRELSWTHYRHLMRVEKPEARGFYETEAVSARWSTRELERQISSLLYERLSLSRDKEGVRSFVLIDLKVGKLMHQDLGQMQMYVNYNERKRVYRDFSRADGPRCPQSL